MNTLRAYLIEINKHYVGFIIRPNIEGKKICPFFNEVVAKMGFSSVDDYACQIPGFGTSGDLLYSAMNDTYAACDITSSYEDIKQEFRMNLRVVRNYYGAKWGDSVYLTAGSLLGLYTDERVDYFIDEYIRTMDTFMFCVMPKIDEVMRTEGFQFLEGNELWFCEDFVEDETEGQNDEELLHSINEHEQHRNNYR